MSSLRQTGLRHLLERLGFYVRKIANEPSGACRIVHRETLERHQKERPDSPFVIFDVGANIGQSAYAYSRWFPEAHILSFEPFPLTYLELQRNTRKLARVKTENLGCSDRVELVEAVLADSAHPTAEVNSVLPSVADNSRNRSFRLQLTSLDVYCEKNAVDYIDILKTDTEGFELKVLQGAVRLLERRRIGSILVEVALRRSVLIPNHVPLDEIESFLCPYGFSLKALFDLLYDPAHGETASANALFRLNGTPPKA